MPPFFINLTNLTNLTNNMKQGETKRSDLKIKEDTTTAIYLWKQGWKLREIAKDLNLSVATISKDIREYIEAAREARKELDLTDSEELIERFNFIYEQSMQQYRQTPSAQYLNSAIKSNEHIGKIRGLYIEHIETIDKATPILSEQEQKLIEEYNEYKEIINKNKQQ